MKVCSLSAILSLCSPRQKKTETDTPSSRLRHGNKAVMRKHNKVEKAETMVRKNASHRSRLEAIRRKAGSGAYQTFVVDGFADA